MDESGPLTNVQDAKTAKAAAPARVRSRTIVVIEPCGWSFRALCTIGGRGCLDEILILCSKLFVSILPRTRVLLCINFTPENHVVLVPRKQYTGPWMMRG
jgi:hypothetical protein